MRYRLRTLLVLLGIGPPIIAFVWFFWWPMLMLILIASLAVAVIAIWVVGCLAIARWFAEISCSPMS